MNVRAVAFDLGGVLTHTAFGGLERYCAEAGLPAATLTGYFRGHPMMARLEVREITSRDFLKFVCIDTERTHGIRLDIHELARAAAEGERLNPDMLELVAEVRATCATALLTNNVAEAGWRESLPFDLFDHVVDSSAVSLRKPDPRIYRLLLELLGTEPAETAFVDDLPDNLVPAREMGITAIQFTGLERCRDELIRLGVLA